MHHWARVDNLLSQQKQIDLNISCVCPVIDNEFGCLGNDDLENDDLENNDPENNDLENNNLENDDLSLSFCRIELIFGRLTCFDMKSIIS